MSNVRRVPSLLALAERTAGQRLDLRRAGQPRLSFAGDDQRSSVNATFIQPFLSFTTKTFTTFALNTESTYDWQARQWTVPLNVSVSQLMKIGGQPMSFALGYRKYVERPEGGPDWGLRFTVTFLFPK